VRSHLTGLTPPVSPLYLGTSAALRAVLEHGTPPEIEAKIATAPLLATSRLALVESARASPRNYLTARRRIESLELLTA
jgi:hypothetical protein